MRRISYETIGYALLLAVIMGIRFGGYGCSIHFDRLAAIPAYLGASGIDYVQTLSPTSDIIVYSIAPTVQPSEFGKSIKWRSAEFGFLTWAETPIAGTRYEGGVHRARGLAQRIGVRVPIDHEIADVLDPMLAAPGSYYSSGNEGFLLTSPSTKTAVFFRTNQTP
jgi:hypothetical protein